MDDYIKSMSAIKAKAVLSNGWWQSKPPDYELGGCVYSQLGIPLHHRGLFQDNSGILCRSQPSSHR